MIEKCKWRPVMEAVYEPGHFGIKNYFETSCRKEVQKIIGQVKCSYCGKEIEEVKDERD